MEGGFPVPPQLSSRELLPNCNVLYLRTFIHFSPSLALHQPPCLILPSTASLITRPAELTLKDLICISLHCCLLAPAALFPSPNCSRLSLSSSLCSPRLLLAGSESQITASATSPHSLPLPKPLPSAPVSTYLPFLIHSCCLCPESNRILFILLLCLKHVPCLIHLPHSLTISFQL